MFCLGLKVRKKKKLKKSLFIIFFPFPLFFLHFSHPFFLHCYNFKKTMSNQAKARRIAVLGTRAVGKKRKRKSVL